jgi:hypothetical protein
MKQKLGFYNFRIDNTPAIAYVSTLILHIFFANYVVVLHIVGYNLDHVHGIYLQQQNFNLYTKTSITHFHLQMHHEISENKIRHK